MRRALAGEMPGTYLPVLFGMGSVVSAVLSGPQAGLGQVASVWGQIVRTRTPKLRANVTME